jgi:hypothetical protein
MVFGRFLNLQNWQGTLGSIANVCQEVGIYLIYRVDWCSLGSVSTLTKTMIILSPKNEFVF